MKVALASHYRGLMWVLLPTTLGIGTAVLWLQSLKWPMEIEEAGLTLRCRRRLSWRAIEKIGVSRSYLDGHVSELRIHSHRTVSRIPVSALRDGDFVAQTILTLFERNRRAGESQRGNESSVVKPQQEKARRRTAGLQDAA